MIIPKHKGFFFFLFVFGGCASSPHSSSLAPQRPSPSLRGAVANHVHSVQLGIDVMREGHFFSLKGKRVGLITNQTSVDSRGEKTRVLMHRSPHVNLVALFAPEHGIEGTIPAAQYVRTRRDALTGLPVYSLYGETRKPTKKMLRGVDVLIFDLQDIGARSYTYISTMALAMQAAAEHRIEFIVLDRPNPLNGLRVQGPPMERKWHSFVGQLPVPYLHGMTSGELAFMCNEKKWMGKRCKLRIVKMQGWQRSMIWQDTRLPWRRTSPNIPKSISPFYYATTGILGSLSGVDIGIGTSRPFEYVGGKGIDPYRFTRELNAMNFLGVRFEPYRSQKKVGFAGSRILIDPRAPIDFIALDILLLAKLNRYQNLFAKTSQKNLDIFYKVYGSRSLERQLRRGTNAEDIVQQWEKYNARFKRERQPYLFYP